jgi:hypothetical protein
MTISSSSALSRRVVAGRVPARNLLFILCRPGEQVA